MVGVKRCRDSEHESKEPGSKRQRSKILKRASRYYLEIVRRKSLALLRETASSIARALVNVPCFHQFQIGDRVTNWYSWKTGRVIYYDSGWPSFIWIRLDDGSTMCREVWLQSKEGKRKYQIMDKKLW